MCLVLIAPTPGAIFKLLSDRSTPADQRLPDTGVGLEWERILSPLFIRSPFYGTRSSTVLLVDRNGKTVFSERVFDESGLPWMTGRFSFMLKRGNLRRAARLRGSATTSWKRPG